MTRVRAIRRGRARHGVVETATACDPPKISKKLSVCGIPSEPRASARLVCPRIPDRRPVTKHGRRCPRSRAGLGKRDGRWALASLDVTRTLRPGTTLPSHMTTGIRRPRRPALTGMAHVSAGREDRGSVARRSGGPWLAAPTGQAGSGEHGVDVQVDRRSERSSKRVERDPRAGTTCASRPTVAPDPAQLRRVGVACSDRADRESRVDMSSRTPARDQQALPRSSFGGLNARSKRSIPMGREAQR